MCTWITELPSQSRTGEVRKKPNLMIYIRPTKPNEYYRFRLLGFKSPKTDRDFPFIPRFVHTIWTKDGNGKNRSESVVCPMTPFVREHWEGNPEKDCPLCKFSNLNYVAYKQSGYTDKESGRKKREFARKFEAIVPVYVVSDPVYPQNNGHFRVFSFSDKKVYESFLKMSKETLKTYPIFNGKGAVDFYIRYEMVEETLNAGKPNEYVWKHSDLKKMGFTTKPYDIAQITKDKIDEFEFDDTFYVSSTKSELEDFYNHHVKGSNSDIPDEDEEISIVSLPKEESKKVSVEREDADDGDEISDLPFENGSGDRSVGGVEDVPSEDIDKFIGDGKEKATGPENSESGTGQKASDSSSSRADLLDVIEETPSKEDSRDSTLKEIDDFLKNL